MLASVLGVEDTDGKPVVIERLMGNSYIDFVPTALGIMLPSCEIRKEQSLSGLQDYQYDRH